MFPFSLYYSGSWDYTWPQVFHAMCMSWFAFKTDGSQVSAARLAMGFQNFARYPISNSVMPQYTIAQDNYGYQIALSQAGTLFQTWSQVGNPTIGTPLGLTGNYITQFATWAQQFYADINARVTKTTPITLFAHGPSAAVAVILGQILKANGYQVKSVFGSAMPKFCDDAAFASNNIPNIALYNNQDWSTYLPPPCLSDPVFMQGDTPLPTLLYTANCPNFGEQLPGGTIVNGLAPARSVFSWANNLPKSDPYESFLQTYISMFWGRMRNANQMLCLPWQIFLNANFSGNFNLFAPNL